MGRSVGFSITLQQNNPLPKSSHWASNTKLPTPQIHNLPNPSNVQHPQTPQLLHPLKLATSSNSRNSSNPISLYKIIKFWFSVPASLRPSKLSLFQQHLLRTLFASALTLYALLSSTSCLDQSSTQTQQPDKRLRHTIKSSKDKTRSVASWA